MSDDLATLAEGVQRRAGLSPLAAVIVAAVGQGVAGDSRAIARGLGIGHALVLRECVALAEESQLLRITSRDERTQRLYLDLSDAGRLLLAGDSA